MNTKLAELQAIVDKRKRQLRKAELKLYHETVNQCKHTSWSGNGSQMVCGKVKITQCHY